SLGKYESDGCIRMQTKDVEELFAIVSTRETIVEIVPAFEQCNF
ncbi:MAG: L,D-transpeptidase, partial [Verrucomicrobia bacterium]|nr:L,D-transpeptidase [Verrucomicrobiota bacterium]